VRVVLQRVARASVTVDGELISSIGRGYLLLVGIGSSDDDSEVERLAEKIVNLRVFPDPDGKMNLALSDVGGEILVVSQFTLYGDLRKGRRPSWGNAADPDVAAGRVEAFAEVLEARGVPKVARGVFGADMQVDLLNDGPVTLILDAAML
jgi:D-tyrosyl-tRNA(Tyr) deacylase